MLKDVHYHVGVINSRARAQESISASHLPARTSSFAPGNRSARCQSERLHTKTLDTKTVDNKTLDIKTLGIKTLGTNSLDTKRLDMKKS